jgi:cell division protein FtsA
MKQDRFITGLDIGSGKTRLAVAQLEEKENGQKKVNIIGFSEVNTEGFTKGNVTNVEDLVSTISLALEKAEMMVGVPVENVCVGIAGNHIVSQIAKGVVAISKANNEIDEDDIDRAVESVKSVAVPPNYENLHVIPTTFNVDNQTGIKDPIGMTGVRLEAEVQVINGLTTRINNFKRSVDRTGLEIDSLVFSILATSEAVLNKKQKELGVLVLDIGHTITKGAIYEDGQVIHAFNVPIGSSHITSDLAIGLRSSIEIAEEVKKKEGNLNLKAIRRSEQVKLSNYEKCDPDNKHEKTKSSFSRLYVNEIIEARVDEIFSYVVKELKKVGRFGKLPAGAVLTGGGSKLPFLVEYAKEKLHLPASLGYPTGFLTSVDKISDLGYAPVCGLVLWSSEDGDGPKRKLFKFKFKSPKLGGKLKKWVRMLTP